MSKKQFSDDRKENHESAKQKVDQVVSTLHLTQDERRNLHDSLGEDYLEYSEILAIAKGMFDSYHISYKDGKTPRW
jgi:hypothetical protein